MGGGPDIPQRNLTDELSQIFGYGYKGQENQYLKFTQKDPLLAAAYPFALGMLGDTTGLKKTLTQNLSPLISSQQGIYSSLLPILQSGGELTPEQAHDVSQSTRAIEAAQGNAHGNQALGTELLNRDTARQQRFQTALGQALGLSSSVSGLTNELTTGQQGIDTTALGNVLNTEQTGVSSFSKVTNPILAYASDLFSSNQNAAAAQSIAGANKSSGSIGGIGSLLGSIISAIPWSDRRLKTDIRPTGRRTKGGIPISRFKYRGSNREFEFPIAQDVEKRQPDAVLKTRSGIRRVIAPAIEAEFTEIPTLTPRKYLTALPGRRAA
jgi:hypothetical protein